MAVTTPVIDEMRERYARLCVERDEKNAKAAPLFEELARINREVEQGQMMARKVMAEIEKIRGNTNWLKLKREIAELGGSLGRRC